MLLHGKVLLVDSHLNMLVGVRSLLESIFEKVFMVADEATLLEMAEKIKFDLIVADFSFPVAEEINIARLLHKVFPDIKVIILSVHDELVAMQECFAAGAVGFVLKRTAVHDLAQAIKTIEKGTMYVSPSILQ
ncbi:hypothetical protein JCM39068_37350 [Desulfocastanea catecholica]